MHLFDEQCRDTAIQMAAQCGLSTRLNLNFLPLSIESSPRPCHRFCKAAEAFNIHPNQIVIKGILEREIIHNFDRF
ncbi:MAG: hypothetical protein R2875_04520 [Desulfobacterales bacterium]